MTQTQTQTPLVQGRLEVTIKISALPICQTVEASHQHFEVDCEGRIVSVTVKPKIWRKLEEANTNYPMWVAAITGRIGEATQDGFILEQPNIQVFEKKPRDPQPPAA